MQDALLIYYCLAGMRSAGCFRIAASALQRQLGTAMPVRAAVVRNSSNATARQRSFLRVAPLLHRLLAPARYPSSAATLATQGRPAQTFPSPEKCVAPVR